MGCLSPRCKRRPRIGTSSLRRAAQLLAARPDATIVPLRGNLDTRLRKADTEDYDAIVLAAAGIGAPWARSECNTNAAF